MKAQLFHKALVGAMLLVVVSCLSSCNIFCWGGHKLRKPKTSYGTVTFAVKEDIINIQPKLKQLLQSKPNCVFLVRVPNKADNVVEEEQGFNRSIYFALEQTLIDSHYVVRDRSLFDVNNDIATEARNNTDLILELVAYKDVQYYTNKIEPETARGNNKKILPSYVYFTGREAKFKIIDIKTNEIVGLFTLNFTPCVTGCTMQFVDGVMTQNAENLVNRHTKRGFESNLNDVDVEEFTNICRRLVEQLHKSARK